MLPPIPSTMTSSCSSINEIAPSPGANAVSLLPVLIRLIFTAFLIAEFGCLASKPTFSMTIPFAWGLPLNGSCFRTPPCFRLACLLRNFLSFHLYLLRSDCIFEPENRPRPKYIPQNDGSATYHPFMILTGATYCRIALQVVM